MPSKLKKAKMTPTIGTHSGTFHCDEALACFMLQLTSKYKNAEIVRSRDKAVLDPLDILVDVGGVYDVEKQRFDHHQKGFFETFDDQHKTKLSSAGLVYKHFGLEIIKSVCSCSDETAQILYKKIYDAFIEAIDGIDNGISEYPTDLEPNYQSKTNLSSRVSFLNPDWNKPDPDEAGIMELFRKAMKMAGSEVLDRIEFYHQSWLPARSIVLDAVKTREEVDKSKKIVKLSGYCPWKEHLHILESELKIDTETPILYCLYPDQKKEWRVQAVSVRSGSFGSRKALPKPWRGLRSDELRAATGVASAGFVHASGFIGGAKTYPDALDMAQQAVNFEEMAD